MKKAYSYLRFSSGQQKDGDSFERQLRIATEYHTHSLSQLPLDSGTYKDAGFSAFKGHQIKKGSLGHFLAAIKAGVVEPGSALICENLDRISRQGPKIARKIIEAVVDNGVDIHIVNLNKILKPGWENRTEDSVVVDVELQRAMKESEQKSERIGSAWKAKKARGEYLTDQLPLWLSRGPKKPVKNDKAKLVVEIFELAAAGLGAGAILKQLNGRGEGLSHTWINKTLASRSVLGEFQAYQTKRVTDRNGTVTETRIPDGPVNFNYYPRVISDKLWREARASIDGRNRMTAERRGQCVATRTVGADNLFGSMVKDTTGGGGGVTMWFERKGKGHNAYLITARNKGAVSHRILYSRFESAFLSFIRDLDWKSVIDEKRDGRLTQKLSDRTALADKLATLRNQINGKERAMDALTEPGDIAVAVRSIARLDTEADETEKALHILDVEIDGLKTQEATIGDPQALLDLLNRPNNVDIRLRLRAEIAKRVSRIGLDWTKATRLTGPAVWMTVDFVNGVRHFASIEEDGSVNVEFNAP